jgi:hypothetical protein
MKNYVITRIKSSFPSAIEIQGDRIFTEGGLILLKLKRSSKDTSFRATVNVAFETPSGLKEKEEFEIGF